MLPAFFESRAQGEKRRACHLPSSGEVFLLIALTPEPPKSGRGQAITGLLKHYRYCQKETGDLGRKQVRRAPPKAATPSHSPALTAPVLPVPDEHHCNFAIKVSWDTLGGDARLEDVCKCLLYGVIEAEERVKVSIRTGG